MAARLDIEALYRSYGHSVLRRARQILGNAADAGDVLQEIFVKLVAQPDQFKGQSAPSTYLYSVTTHACLARLRDGRNRLRLVDAHVKPWASDVDPERADTLAILRAELARLPEDQARAAVYYHLDGMTHAEIAEVMDCSRRHVGDLLERVQDTLTSRAS
jgi:RNA polymerase sigma factor (sigma-70 family)